MDNYAGIRNPMRFNQKILFEGMKYGPTEKWAPTDIDLAFELRGKLFVLGEYKFVGEALTMGQRLLLESFCKGWRGDGRKAYAFHAEHNTPTDRNVEGAECIVVKYFNGVVWNKDGQRTVKQFLFDCIHEVAPQQICQTCKNTCNVNPGVESEWCNLWEPNI